MNQFRRLRLSSLFLSGLALTHGQHAIADDFVWTGLSDIAPNAWTVDTNWLNTSTPGPTDLDGIPDTDDSARFTIDAEVGNGSTQNLTIDASVTLSIASGNITVFDGVIENAGVITFTSDAPGAASVFGVAGNVTLGGNGEFVMQSGFNGFSPNGPATLTHEAGHTVRGFGNINVDFINNGKVLADSPDGAISLGTGLATFTFGVAGTTSVLLDGTAFSESGRFQAIQTSDLGGTLELLLGDTFTAQIGDTYTILTSTDPTEPITSTFSSVDQTNTNGYEFDVIYSSDSVSVKVVAVPEPSAAALIALGIAVLTRSRLFRVTQKLK